MSFPIQRQADQYSLAPHCYQASVSNEDLRDILAGPRIQAGLLNVREGISRTNPAGDLNKAPYKLNQEALQAMPKPPKPKPIPDENQMNNVSFAPKPLKQNVARRQIVADDNGPFDWNDFKKGPFGQHGWNPVGWLGDKPGGNSNRPPAEPNNGPTSGKDFAKGPFGQHGWNPFGWLGDSPANGGGSNKPADPTTPAASSTPTPGGNQNQGGGGNNQSPTGTWGGGPVAGNPDQHGSGPGYLGAGYQSGGGDWLKSNEETRINPGNYTVKPGDTASDIAQRAGVPLSSLTGLGNNPNFITPGQNIGVPTPGAGSPVYHSDANTTLGVPKSVPGNGPGGSGGHTPTLSELNAGGGAAPPAGGAAPPAGGADKADYKSWYGGGAPAAPAAPAAAHGAPVQGPGLPGNPGGPPKTSAYRMARDAHGRTYFDDSQGYRYFLAQEGDKTVSDNPDLDEIHRREQGGTPPSTPSVGVDIHDQSSGNANQSGNANKNVGGKPPMNQGGGGGIGRTNDLANAPGPTNASGMHGAPGQPGSLMGGGGMMGLPGMGSGGGGFGNLGEIISPLINLIPGLLGGLGGFGGGMGGFGGGGMGGFGGGRHGARKCGGSNQYPTAQHTDVEQLYRCAGCGLWGPLSVLGKMVEHRKIEAGTGVGGSGTGPNVGMPGTGGAAISPGGMMAQGGEMNSGITQGPSPLAPLTGTGAAGVLNATDTLTQSAGSPMLPGLR